MVMNQKKMTKNQATIPVSITLDLLLIILATCGADLDSVEEILIQEFNVASEKNCGAVGGIAALSFGFLNDKYSHINTRAEIIIKYKSELWQCSLTVSPNKRR